MPRPKSELTNNRRCVSIQLTPVQHAEWKRIGGAKFLRILLSQSIEGARIKSGHATIDLEKTLKEPA